MNVRSCLLLGFSLLLAPALVLPAQVTIPRGTAIFGELDERITSNAKKFRVGYEVDGHVWKDVTVNGQTVIPAGTPMALRISKINSSSVGGQGGSLEIMAVSVKTIDGTEIFLEGGYDQAGGDRYGLTRALSYIIWPSVFLPGRRAVLDEGTVFDATIPANTDVTVPDDRPPTLNLAAFSDLTVEISYDEIDQREGSLPLELTLCNSDFVQRADVTSVNENRIRPILITIVSRETIDSCYFFRARVNLESLTEHFSKGINRFSVTMGEAQTSVILNVEM